MAFPVTINGRTYTLADFSGQNYVTGFPDALEDFVTEAGQTVTDAEAAQTAAETAQTGAEAAQTAAEAAQAAAEAAQEAIDGLYLGAQASNPTVDLNGDPLTAGDWYFNTTDNNSRVYDGSSWNIIDPDLSGDASPTLGGDLDGSGYNISGVGDLTMSGDLSVGGGSGATAVTATIGGGVTAGLTTLASTEFDIANSETLFRGPTTAGVMSDHDVKVYGNVKTIIPAGLPGTGQTASMDLNYDGLYPNGSATYRLEFDTSANQWHTPGGFVIDGDVGIGGDPSSPNGFSRNLTISGSSCSLALDETDSNTWEMIVSSGSLRFYDETSERMRLDSSGNLGVGTNTPSSRAEIYGLQTASGNRTSPYQVLTITANYAGGDGQPYYTTSTDTGFGGGIVFKNESYDASFNDSAAIYSSIGDNSIDADGGRLGFYTSATRGGSLINRMQIDFNGHIGFGVLDPSEHSNNGGVTVAASNATGAEFVAFRDDGGIADGDFCGGYIIGNRDASGTPNHYGGMWAVANDIYGDMDLKFGADRESYETDTAQMILTADGNVGIGEQGPDGLLHLKSTAPDIILEDSDSSSAIGSSNRVRFRNSSGTYSAQIGNDPSISSGTNFTLGTLVGYGVSILTNGTEKVTVDSAGHLEMAGPNYAYGGSNYAFRLNENSGDAFIGNIEGGLFLSSGYYYYGGGLRQMDSGVTSGSEILLGQNGNVVFGNVTGATAGSTHSYGVRMTLDSSGHLIVPNGVTLGTAANTYVAANTLDDYEEGTWSPILRTSNVDGSYSITTVHSAVYTKIGRMVFYSMYAAGLNENIQGTGSMQIAGLPFNSLSSAYTGGLSTYGASVATGDGARNIVQAGAAYLRLVDESTGNDVSANIFTTQNSIIIAGMYFTS